jgi:transcriptional regulator with XRE-family HTH domain
MPSTQPIAANPSLIAWARAESGYAVERVAKRLQVTEERVVAWEKGERQPTLRQLEALARFLHRPLSVFFLPRRPQLLPLAAEYRRLPDVEPGHESPELRLALRQMLTRRENALNLMGELGESVPKFSLRAHLRESAAQVGRSMGFATPTGKSLNRAGRPFAQLVLEALSANRITSVDASRYLDLKFEHFDKLRAQLAWSPGDARLDG